MSYINNPYSLFRKYAKLVTWFTRHQLGRDYLGVPEGITWMVPNGYHQGEQVTLYTSARYAPALYPALKRLDTVSSYIHSFDDAVKILFYQTGLIRNPYLVPDVMLVEFNPNAHPESTSVDGFCQYFNGSGEAWGTIRGQANATTTSDSDAAASGGRIRADTNTNTWDIFERSFYLYDTSSLGSGADIVSANTQIYVASLTDNFNQSYDIVSSAPASNTALVNGDFDSLGTTAYASTDITSLSTSAFNTFALNASGLAAIAKTGITKFGGRISGDTSNTEPTWSSGVDCVVNVNFADSTNDPKLVVLLAGGAQVIWF